MKVETKRQKKIATMEKVKEIKQIRKDKKDPCIAGPNCVNQRWNGYPKI